MKYAAGIPKSEYKKEITSIFASNTSRGFADWRPCGSLEMDISRFLDDARITLSEEGRYDLIMEIAEDEGTYGHGVVEHFEKELAKRYPER